MNGRGGENVDWHPEGLWTRKRPNRRKTLSARDFRDTNWRRPWNLDRRKDNLTHYHYRTQDFALLHVRHRDFAQPAPRRNSTRSGIRTHSNCNIASSHERTMRVGSRTDVLVDIKIGKMSTLGMSLAHSEKLEPHTETDCVQLGVAQKMSSYDSTRNRWPHGYDAARPRTKRPHPSNCLVLT